MSDVLFVMVARGTAEETDDLNAAVTELREEYAKEEKPDGMAAVGVALHAIEDLDVGSTRRRLHGLGLSREEIDALVPRG